jgi:peptidoglycan/LPS O-acetylase OafA/YrhL
MTGGHLSRSDTDLFKGVGILLIVLHNYFHWVKPSPGENEFNFNRQRTERLFEGLAAEPLESVNLLLDYFGHYGVQIFVFLSAYGLARAYAGQSVPWLTFMLRRAARLYPAFVLAVLIHLLFVVTLWNEALWWFVKVYLLKLSMLSVFVPDMAFSLVGPWWFFSFIVQFYAVFPALNRLAQRYGSSALAAVGLVSLVATAAFNPYLIDRGLNLYVTVIGHLPVLCLGIHFARATEFRIGGGLALAAAAAFSIGLFFHTAWLLAPLCVTVTFMWLLPHLAARIDPSGLPSRFVTYCGAISLPLFAVHGMLRAPFVQAANERGAWWFTLGAGACFLAVSFAVAQLMHWAEAGGRAWYQKWQAAREALG